MAGGRRRRIDLALQGGGAHGAFTWGVLDRLLEDERIEFDAVSGTSAGAMNAVVLADGLAAGGRRLAREKLRRFWGRVSQVAAAGGALNALFGDWAVSGSPLAWYLDWVTRVFSPYQFNPLDINPLRDIVASEVDFERVRRFDRLQIFVSATHVRTGRLREFRKHELSVEAVMASACLPLLFRAVEIDGEAYWDGGYVGNPSLLPLVAESPAHDLVLVQINPSNRAEVPSSAQQILDRLNEITFNSSLQAEIRMAAFVARLVDQGRLPHGRGPGEYKRVNLHRIALSDALKGLTAGSKVVTDYDFLLKLQAAGKKAARYAERRAAKEAAIKAATQTPAKAAAPAKKAAKPAVETAPKKPAKPTAK
ncbi:MAG: patatin-like phospholipase family protein [Burkholderiaceae bacterium]